MTDPTYPPGNAIVLMEHPLKQKDIIEGKLIAENHELINHLNWDSAHRPAERPDSASRDGHGVALAGRATADHAAGGRQRQAAALSTSI